LVFVGALAGAPLRYLTDRFVQSRHGSMFPWGTFTVNLAGCLTIGCLAGAGFAMPASIYALLGTGFCGALTTYSTFSHETFRLAESKALFYAIMNVVVSLAAGLGAAMIGYLTLSAARGG
jgi:CrcB protein